MRSKKSEKKKINITDEINLFIYSLNNPSEFKINQKDIAYNVSYFNKVENISPEIIEKMAQSLALHLERCDLLEFENYLLNRIVDGDYKEIRDEEKLDENSFLTILFFVIKNQKSAIDSNLDLYRRCFRQIKKLKIDNEMEACFMLCELELEPFSLTPPANPDLYKKKERVLSEQNNFVKKNEEFEILFSKQLSDPVETPEIESSSEKNTNKSTPASLKIEKTFDIKNTNQCGEIYLDFLKNSSYTPLAKRIPKQSVSNPKASKMCKSICKCVVS